MRVLWVQLSFFTLIQLHRATALQFLFKLVQLVQCRTTVDHLKLESTCDPTCNAAKMRPVLQHELSDFWCMQSKPKGLVYCINKAGANFQTSVLCIEHFLFKKDLAQIENTKYKMLSLMCSLLNLCHCVSVRVVHTLKWWKYSKFYT